MSKLLKIEGYREVIKYIPIVVAIGIPLLFQKGLQTTVQYPLQISLLPLLFFSLCNGFRVK